MYTASVDDADSDKRSKYDMKYKSVVEIWHGISWKELWHGMCQCNISLPGTGSCYSIRISKL